MSKGPASPSIAGFHMRYLFRVMRQYRDRERAATIMDRIASAYTPKELRSIATHYSEMPWGDADFSVDEDKYRE